MSQAFGFHPELLVVQPEMNGGIIRTDYEDRHFWIIIVDDEASNLLNRFLRDAGAIWETYEVEDEDTNSLAVLCEDGINMMARIIARAEESHSRRKYHP